MDDVSKKKMTIVSVSYKQKIEHVVLVKSRHFDH